MTDEFELRRRRQVQIEYYEASQPIIIAMARLRLGYTAPWMIVREGVVEESGENWTDNKARELYDAYAATLRQLLETIERSSTGSNTTPIKRLTKRSAQAFARSITRVLNARTAGETA